MSAFDRVIRGLPSINHTRMCVVSSSHDVSKGSAIAKKNKAALLKINSQKVQPSTAESQRPTLRRKRRFDLNGNISSLPVTSHKSIYQAAGYSSSRKTTPSEDESDSKASKGHNNLILPNLNMVRKRKLGKKEASILINQINPVADEIINRPSQLNSSKQTPRSIGSRMINRRVLGAAQAIVHNADKCDDFKSFAKRL